MQRAIVALGVAALAFGTGSSRAETRPLDFYADGPYLQSAPRPEAFLGYELGTLHTHHFRMQDYFEALAAAVPERIRLVPYGESYEKKQLFIAVVSSEENLAGIEEIRRRNLALADPLGTSAAEAEAILADAPVVVWLDYGNDGNETANVEAAMQVAYQLTAGEGEEARRFRREAVVVIGPDHNPESHDRHVTWYNAFGVGDPEPRAMEHRAPWGMSTNNNHYQIDLNRDAWALTQVENQAAAAAVLRWRPQVFADHHGQTENYFFAPPVAPINPALPESHLRWYEEFGRGNARAFDRQGWQYYVRDVFDLYYPGYWDSWPSLHGAIGMTYETDGGGYRGLAWRRGDGSIVTFRDGIEKHFVASIATVRTAVENRPGLLRDFRQFFATGVEEGRAGDPARAYVLDATADPRRSAALVGTLMRHGIAVRRTAAPFAAMAKGLADGTAGRVEFPAGSYLVDMAQADKRAAEAYLESEVALDPEFADRQLARWSRNARRGAKARQEWDEFYDLTTWSLPVAFGVEGWSLAELPAVESAPVAADPERLVGSGDWSDELAFDPEIASGIVGRVASVDGALEPIVDEGTRARTAYLFAGGSEGALRLAARLLAEDYRVTVSQAPLQVGAHPMPRGTFVLRVGRNPESLHERLPALAREAGVAVYAADTAFPSSGQTGVGSNPVTGLRKPRIAMVADEGVRITEYGAAWFTLERRLDYPFTPIRLGELAGADLDVLDVIVFPHGSSSTYRQALGDEGLAALGGWIERGGTLVAWGPGGAGLAMAAEWTDATFAGRSEDSKEKKGDEASASDRLAEIDALSDDPAPKPPVSSPTADPGAPQAIPGSVARTLLDRTHWLTLGLEQDELPVLVWGDDFLTLSKKGENPVVFAPEDRVALSGFFWPGNSARWLAGAAWAIVEPRGKGQVILFAHDPNFRLTWRATSRFFGNALLLGPTLGTRATEGL